MALLHISRSVPPATNLGKANLKRASPEGQREPEADRVGECYEVRPDDIGVHLLLAPAGEGGAREGWTAGLVAVLAAYVLVTLDRQRIVVDPGVRNEKAIDRFLRQGFVPGPKAVLPEVSLPDVHLPDVHLPRKHAQLAFLPRAVAFPA
ncbi:acetyltransferase [Streptomyces sp. TRM70350]|nr:acetyltransferase [Streptomyces sp. TRM70350]